MIQGGDFTEGTSDLTGIPTRIKLFLKNQTQVSD